MYRWWKPIKSGQISALTAPAAPEAASTHVGTLRGLSHEQSWCWPLEIPMECHGMLGEFTKFTNTPRSPRIQHWIQPIKNIPNGSHGRVCINIYIYGFSYGLQCPISFGDITNGRGNKQVSIDAGIWKNICGFVLNVHGISQGGLKTLGEKSELSGAGGKYLEEYFPIYWCKQTEILSQHVFYLHPVHHCDNDHFAMLSWGIDLS